DNGLSGGEHRWTNKKAGYEEDIRVPLIVRYDSVISTPRHDAHLVLNLDLAPTMAEAAGVAAPGVEGQSMVPLFTDPEAPWRPDFLAAHHKTPSRDQIPTSCETRDDGLQPEGYSYTVYETGEEELYDLRVDPYQLGNQASSPDYATQLAALRVIAQQLCSPTPPGFTFSYDVLPPSVPTGLAATAIGPTQIDLAWTAATDNVGVTGYTIYRDGLLVGTVDGATTGFSDTGLTPDTTYTYAVD